MEPNFVLNQTSIKPDFTTTTEIVFNITTTSEMNFNITSTSTIDTNLTTMTNETTPSRKNNGYIHQKNTVLFPIFFLLFKIILS